MVPPKEEGVLTHKTPTSNAVGVKWWDDKRRGNRRGLTSPVFYSQSIGFSFRLSEADPLRALAAVVRAAPGVAVVAVVQFPVAAVVAVVLVVPAVGYQLEVVAA